LFAAANKLFLTETLLKDGGGLRAWLCDLKFHRVCEYWNLEVLMVVQNCRRVGVAEIFFQENYLWPKPCISFLKKLSTVRTFF